MDNLVLGWPKTAFSAILTIAAVLFLAGCVSSKPASIADFHESSSAAGIKLVDMRPSEDRTSEVLSYVVTSCDYAIYRIGDEMTIPSRLILLQQDMEQAKGDQLRNSTVTIQRYRIFLNSGAALRKNVFSPPGGSAGLVPAIMKKMGSNCSKDETTGGWYAASEVSTTNSPIIIEIGAAIADKSYATRVVYSPKVEVSYFKLDDAEIAAELFAAIHRADTELIAQIGSPASSVPATKPDADISRPTSP